MKKYTFTIDICAAMKIDVIAESEEAAEEKAEEYIQSENFFEDARKAVDLWNPEIDYNVTEVKEMEG